MWLNQRRTSALFNLGLIFSVFAFWLFGFGALAFQRLGLLPYYDHIEKRLLVFQRPETLVPMSTNNDPPISIQIYCPQTIDLDSSKPLKLSIIPHPQISDVRVSPIIIEDEHVKLLRDPSFRTTIKPKLDAPSFDFDRAERPLVFSEDELNWQWIVTPKKEGNQSLLFDLTFESIAAANEQIPSRSFHIMSNPIDLTVVKPFITLGQINLATIFTAILSGLLAMPKLIDIAKQLAKRKPRPSSFTALEENQAVTVPARAVDPTSKDDPRLVSFSKPPTTKRSGRGSKK